MRVEEQLFSKIMVPVDLAHLDHLARPLEVAADLARHYGASACYVGVTAETPTAVAHNPAEFEQKVQEFAASEASKHGIEAEGRGYPSTDPAIDINRVLVKAADDTGADLIVIAAHIPNIADHLWPSHGDYVATHSKASVMVVRSQGEK